MTENTPQEQQPSEAQLDYRKAVECFEAGKLSEAAYALHNARIGFEQEGNEEGLANVHFRMGDILLAQNEYAKALEHFTAAEATCRKHDDLMSLMAIRKKVVLCQRGLGRFQEALNGYLTLLDNYEALNNPAGSVATMVSIGELYEEMGDRAKAADAFATAAAIHTNYGHKEAAAKLARRVEELGG
ncbi:MAG: tetratricopeptide repeat protein [Thermodesulfobacteriota bacterium]